MNLSFNFKLMLKFQIVGIVTVVLTGIWAGHYCYTAAVFLYCRNISPTNIIKTDQLQPDCFSCIRTTKKYNILQSST